MTFYHQLKKVEVTRKSVDYTVVQKEKLLQYDTIGTCWRKTEVFARAKP